MMTHNIWILQMMLIIFYVALTALRTFTVTMQIEDAKYMIYFLLHDGKRCSLWWEAVEKETAKKHKGRNRKSNYPDNLIHKHIRYYCDFCDYQATQPNSLTLHIKQIHTSEVHVCKECNFETNVKQRLKEHTKEYHIAKSNFPCTLCDFMGISAGDLKKHIEERHDATKFPCDKCSYKASTPGHLAYHIKKLHCPYCDMVLFSKRDSHIKMHEQENYGGLRRLHKVV